MSAKITARDAVYLARIPELFDGTACNKKESLVSSLFDGGRVNHEFIPGLVIRGQASIDRSDKTTLADAGFVALN